MEKEKQKKPIFKKWWFWLLIVIIIGAVASSGDSDDPTSTSDNNQASNADSSVEAEESESYKIGDVVQLGDIQYTIHGVEQASTIGSEYVNTEANGVFLVVDLTVKNIGNESAMVTSSFFKLKNGEKTFDADSSAMIYINQEGNSSLFLDNLNPDVEMSGKVVFDISQETADSENLVLQAQTGYWGTETVDIQLTK